MKPNELVDAPIEQAWVGADRVQTRTAAVEFLAVEVSEGRQTCGKCQHRRADQLARLDDRIVPLCHDCKADVDLDAQIAKSRAHRASMGRWK